MDRAVEPAADDLSPFDQEPEVAHDNRRGDDPFEGMHDEPVSRPGERLRGWHWAFTELPLLLPFQRLQVLERAAVIEGMTVGQLLRRLIHNWLTMLKPPPSQQPTLRDAAAAENRKAGKPGGLARQSLVGMEGRSAPCCSAIAEHG
jgi:hypothetical protein